MGKRPPTYTFRRPRKTHEPPIPVRQTEHYTPIDDQVEKTYDYAKYSFILLLVLFFIYCFGMVYTYKYGLPVKIKS